MTIGTHVSSGKFRGRLSRVLRIAVLSAAVIAPLVACSSGSNPAGSNTTTPAPRVTIHGDANDPVNKIVIQAIADLQRYWSQQFPKLYGSPYTPVTGGFYAVAPSSGELPPCAETVADITGNAFYCGAQDVVAWDVEGLLPTLRKKFGDFVIPIVLAHEWGHAIQTRANFQGLTVTKEIQADCFAGAWAADIGAGHSSFKAGTNDLDAALAGFLTLRDEPGTDKTNPAAHGSGFDRVNSFQTGFDGGPETCRDYKDGSPPVIELPFRSLQELATGGNVPYDQVLNLVPADLEDFWAQTFPALTHKPWTPVDVVGFDPGEPPTCGGSPPSDYVLFYCAPEDYIGYDAANLPRFYYQGGDFGVATLFANEYGQAVNARDGDHSDDKTAALRGDCFAGAWSASVLLENRPTSKIRMSPGDLDKAVAALLVFRGFGDKNPDAPGFTRVDAYRAGLLNGPDACTKPMPAK
ncbi:neutral zinc metallopeptidase [Nocardia vinacea]|uniref:neutral zinc metallopeptidase n=1 Tax=Nocardia vinacea TaxID=96468 RepID=UPI002E13E4AD|nr:neutral zinc metallopeptidase [Nocardia vinacea]